MSCAASTGSTRRRPASEQNDARRSFGVTLPSPAAVRRGLDAAHGEVAVVQRRAATRAEHRVAVAASALGELEFEQPDELALDGGEDHDGARAGLRLEPGDPADVAVAAARLQLAADVELVLDEVDVAPAQPERLATAAAPSRRAA